MQEAPGSVTRWNREQNLGNDLHWAHRAKARRGLGSSWWGNSDSCGLQGALCLPVLALKKFQAGEMVARSGKVIHKVGGDLGSAG